MLLGACLLAIGLRTSWVSGAQEINQVLRDRVLAYEFAESDDHSTWAHVSLRGAGGLACEGDSIVPHCVQLLKMGFLEVLQFMAILLLCVMNGWFLWHNFRHLPARDPDEPQNIGKHLVAWAELLGFLLLLGKLCVDVGLAALQALRANAAHDHVHRTLAIACGCDAFADGLRLLRRFSCLLLLPCLDLGEMPTHLRQAFERHRKAFTKGGSECAVCLAAMCALLESMVWGGLAVLSLSALAIKMSQVNFVVEIPTSKWTRTQWVLFACFANIVVGIKEARSICEDLLATALADQVDMQVVSAGSPAGAGSRFRMWRRNVLGRIAEERRSLAQSVVLASTVDAQRLASLLFRAEGVQVGDVVVATQPCAVPAEKTGILEQLEPVPIVRWTSVLVHTRVQLKGLQDFACGRKKVLTEANGVYELASSEESLPAWPLYVHVGGQWVLVPEVGDLAQPAAMGWSLTETSRLIPAKAGDPPRYCGVPVAWCDGQYQTDPCGKQWYVEGAAGVGLSAKDSVQCLPAELNKELPARWGVGLAQIRREQPFWQSEGGRSPS